jgi:lysophospholipid acyltransferase (LPLAT)-like uncharacterized protein
MPLNVIEDLPTVASRNKTAPRVIPHRPRLLQRLGAWLICATAKTVYATFRFQPDNRSVAGASLPAPAIYCLWHNRLAFAEAGHQLFVKTPRPEGKLAALISASRDGAFLSTILEKFQIQPVRGSSSRRGAQAMLELTSWAERGYDIAITPDGPRGPAYAVQPGAISLAQVTGLPIIPVSFNMGWKLKLNTWDKFQIPIPFSRIIYAIGQPLRIPREASEAEREKLRQNLEAQLRALTAD